MTSATKFWDKIADRYARRPIANQEAYEKKLEITRSYLKPDMSVFEFGCGTGSTAIAHAPFVGQILATDLSPRMIEIAREKAAANSVSNVEFKVAAIDDADIAPDSYDAVLGLSILHLVDDMGKTISKVHRILKPGGVFVSSTACIADFMPFMKYILPIGNFFGLLPPVRIFGKDELEETITRAGFQIEQNWQPAKSEAVFIVAIKS